MKALRALVVLTASLVACWAWAQEPVDVVVAGRIIARIRDKGTYASLAERAAKVDQRLADVLSFENTQRPNVSAKRVGGLWHVFVGKRDVIAVFPGDAKPQRIDPRLLAGLWMRNLRTALPLATPVSKLPKRPTGVTPVTPTPPRPKTGGVVPVPKPAPAPSGVTGVVPAPSSPITEPSTAVAPQTPGASTTPSGEAVPAPAPKPAEPKATPRSAALLLLLDSFNSVRALTDEEYLAGRDRVASHLLENLEPFMTEARAQGEAAGTPQPPRPITVVSPETPPLKPPTPVAPTTTVTPKKPPTPTAKTPAKPPAVAPKVPTAVTPSVPSVPTVPRKGAKAATGKPARSGIAYARQPQKQRIGRKFAAAAGPYQQLRAGGGANADQVGALLKTARDAFAAGDFDASESSLDQALQLMGVPTPK
jgi:hypothetical protein